MINISKHLSTFAAKLRYYMNYWKYIFGTENSEILLAFISHLPFDTFEETPEGLNAYLPEKNYHVKFDEELSLIKKTFPFTFRKEFIEWQNWNKKWESQFTPILIDDFCGIRATFHPPIMGIKHEIVIAPKMAFGSGHHETTRLMIRGMSAVDMKGKTVLDYGSGTGILAFLAEKVGAAKVNAVDISLPAFENAQENASLNKIKKVDFFHGTLNTLPTETYDIILANIIQNVLLDSIASLKNLLNVDGIILFSGILSEGLELMNTKLKENGLCIKSSFSENNWLLLHVEHDEVAP